MNNKTKKVQLWMGGFLLAVALVFMAGCTDTPGNPGSSGGDSGTGSSVARVNGVYVEADDLTIYISQAFNSLMWEYIEMTGEWEIDFQREFRDGKTFERVVREEAVRLAAFSIITDEYAMQLGVTLTDEDIERIEEHIEFLEEMYGEEEFYIIMEQEGFRDVEHLADFFGSQVLFDNIIDTIIESPDVFVRFEQHMPEEEDFSDIELLGAKHILANFAEFDSEGDAETHAFELLERAHAGEDFDMLIRTYGQDPGMMTFVNGYTFTSGDMVPEFEQATRDLAIGEISGLVHSDFGIHIIMRVEPNIDYWFMLRGMEPPTLEGRMVEAVLIGFQEMVDNANIEFLRALDNVRVEPETE